MHPAFLQAGDEEEGDEPEEAPEVFTRKNVFTSEDLLMLEEQLEPTRAEEEDEAYRREFMAELKRQELLEKARERVVFRGDEDDDQYLVDFEKDEDEAESYLEREKRKADKKELKRVDHALEQYEAITKCLYIETKEVGKMTDKEVSEFRKLNGDIKVLGLKCPRPISSWY